MSKPRVRARTDDYLHARGAHSVSTVKDNQQRLRSQLVTLPWKDMPIGYHETEISHGQPANQIYKAVTIAAGIAFPHGAQAIEIVRTGWSIASCTGFGTGGEPRIMASLRNLAISLLRLARIQNTA